MRHIGWIVGSSMSALNLFAFFTMGHQTINLLVAVFCAGLAAASWAFTKALSA